MDFEYHDDDDHEPPRKGSSDKIEITWLTIALVAAVIILIALAIYTTRDMPLIPPP